MRIGEASRCRAVEDVGVLGDVERTMDVMRASVMDEVRRSDGRDDAEAATVAEGHEAAPAELATRRTDRAGELAAVAAELAAMGRRQRVSDGGYGGARLVMTTTAVAEAAATAPVVAGARLSVATAARGWSWQQRWLTARWLWYLLL